MRNVISILLFLCAVTTSTAHFLYNELEDFRITTTIRRKTVPDAIRQMIGFYPIRMSIDSTEITVECPQKTANRYKGNRQPLQGYYHRRARSARSLRQHRPALAPGLHIDYWWSFE